MQPHDTMYCACGCGQPLPKPKFPSRQRRYIAGHFGRTQILGSIEESFWAKVNKGGPDECWIWQAAHDDFGYGQLAYKQKKYRAHRLSYEMHIGSIPKDMYVCHNCPDGADNPGCVNPAHLFLGTAAQNSADMVRKGRQSRGEGRTAAKFTDAQIVEIRALYAQGITIKSLSERYSVGQGTIHSIVHRNTWKHVP